MSTTQSVSVERGDHDITLDQLARLVQDAMRHEIPGHARVRVRGRFSMANRHGGTPASVTVSSDDVVIPAP